MADVNTDANVTTNEGVETQVTETKPKANTPSVDDLMAQLAQERADREKVKQSLDKTLKENGELKKTIRSKQTVEEQEAEERKEAEAQRQKEYEDAINELNHMKATQAYTNVLGDDKQINNMISAVADGDHKGIALILDTAIKSAVKTAQAEWLKSRPQVNVGSGAYSGMTKAEIMKISDRTERRKAIAENMDLFS